MNMYLLPKKVDELTSLDLFEICGSYRQTGLPCLSHLEKMISLPALKKSLYDLPFQFEITPEFSFPDNKLIIYQRNDLVGVKIFPNAESGEVACIQNKFKESLEKYYSKQ